MEKGQEAELEKLAQATLNKQMKYTRKKKLENIHK